MYSVGFQYVVVANCVLCVFHRERTSEEQATYHSYFSIQVESILLPLGSSNEGIVVRHSPIFTVPPSTSVTPSSLLRLLQLHHSTVLLHLLATILCHVIMLLDNSTLSTILLLMWIRLVYYLTAPMKSKFLQLQNMLPPVDAFILLSWFSFIN